MTNLVCLCLLQAFPSFAPATGEDFHGVLALLVTVALLVGLGLGIAICRYAHWCVYRDHLDKHFFSPTPDRNCFYCFHERGIRTGVQQ